jgi:misacylated tRNA(Ala) deacylase
VTELLFHTDSYLQKFDAEIIGMAEEEKAIILDRTAFYPGGGGQPADNGYLDFNGEKIVVMRAKRDGGDILHYLEIMPDFQLQGTKVLGQIDWDKRYKLMRTHTAMHVLCGVIFRDYGASVTGGDMQPLKGRMDFEFETMRKELVKEIEEAVNFEIDQAREVSARILPRDDAFLIPDLIRTKINLLPEGITEVRVVEIEGLDIQADGGTHVKNTSEIGNITIADYKSKGKINKRIYLEISE